MCIYSVLCVMYMYTCIQYMFNVHSCIHMHNVHVHVHVFVDSDSEPEDNVRLWEDGWKERYYQNKFGVPSDDDEFVKSLAEQYTRGLCWVLGYYYQVMISNNLLSSTLVACTGYWATTTR